MDPDQTHRGAFLCNIYQSKWVRFLMRSWVIAVILGSILFLSLKINPDPYQFTLIDSSSFVPDPEEYCEFYLDLNSDGICERFHFANIEDSSSCLYVNTAVGGPLEQWNFKGKLSGGMPVLLSGDFDHNGKVEVSVITIFREGIYLNIIEPFGNDPVVVDNLLIDTLWRQYGIPYPLLLDALSCDLNDDGYDEIVFSFTSNYARQPRKDYAYDLKNKNLKSSPYGGSFLSSVSTVDADHDGRIELAGRCTAPNNYTDELIPLQDSSSWYIILDENLKFKVPPLKLGPVFSETVTINLPDGNGLSTYVFVYGFQDSLPVFKWFRVLEDYSLQQEVFLYNPDFKHPYSFVYPSSGLGGLFYNRIDKVLFINEKGKCNTIRGFPKRIIPMKVLNPKAGINGFEYCLAIDGTKLSLSFFSINGKKLGSINKIDYSDLVSISWVGKVNGKYQLFLSGRSLFQWFEVRSNPWQYLRFLVWLGFILGFFGFIKLIRLGQSYEFTRKENLRRQIVELQLRTIKNQLDPHFTFNALNGLSHLALSGETEKVKIFIDHFSRLLRTHLQMSDQALVKLSQEIEFLEHYMELQRMRFEDLINWKIDVHQDVDVSLLVPKLLLQTHVENAVKHGLRSRLHVSAVTKSFVEVSIFKQSEETVIMIEDNGVGRGNALIGKDENSGKGLLILDEIYSSVRQLYKLSITQEFEDLKDDAGNPSGTRVKIVIR